MLRAATQPDRLGTHPAYMSCLSPGLAGPVESSTARHLRQARLPDMPDDEILRRLLGLRGGVARRRQVVAVIGKRALRDALADGALVRVGRGRYALPDLDDAATEAARLSATVSHRSAALHHGWSVATAPERPELTVPRKRHLTAARRGGADVHWRDLPSTSVTRSRGVSLTHPVQTVVDCARDLPWPEALAVADSALRSGSVTRDQLLAAAQVVRTTGRAQVLRVVEAADGRAANAFESVLRAIALDVPGLCVEPQVRIDERGLRLTPDLVDRGRRLVIEAESWQFHGHRKALHADCGRYNALVLRGWTVLRFSWEHVMLEPHYVRDVLLAVVGGPEGQAALTQGLVWAP